MFDFESHRRKGTRTINLLTAYRERYSEGHEVAEEYLNEIELTFPIISRQCAGIAITTAHHLQSMHLE